MTARMKPNLHAVPDVPEPPKIDLARDIYAEVRAVALDSERWRRMHERAQRRPPIALSDPVKRLWAR